MRGSVRSGWVGCVPELVVGIEVAGDDGLGWYGSEDWEEALELVGVVWWNVH